MDYTHDALEFVNRAATQLPARPSDARAIARLWLEADRLDDMICSLLSEVNTGLIKGVGKFDTTRGMSIRPLGPAEEGIFYDCTWSLVWGEDRGVSVNLAIEPRSSIFEIQIHALKASESVSARFPINEAELKEALAAVYVAEVTIDILSEQTQLP